MNDKVIFLIFSSRVFCPRAENVSGAAHFYHFYSTLVNIKLVINYSPSSPTGYHTYGSRSRKVEKKVEKTIVENSTLRICFLPLRLIITVHIEFVLINLFFYTF